MNQKLLRLKIHQNINSIYKSINQNFLHRIINQINTRNLKINIKVHKKKKFLNYMSLITQNYLINNSNQ